MKEFIEKLLEAVSIGDGRFTYTAIMAIASASPHLSGNDRNCLDLSLRCDLDLDPPKGDFKDEFVEEAQNLIDSES